MKDEYQRANLHREARVMAILRHPNIVRLYETLKVLTLITYRFCCCGGGGGGGWRQRGAARFHAAIRYVIRFIICPPDQ